MIKKERQCLDCGKVLPRDAHRNAVRCWTCSRKRTDKLRRIGELNKLNSRTAERIVILQGKMEDRGRTISELKRELGLEP